MSDKATQRDWVEYRFPLAMPDLSGGELGNLTDAIKHEWISSGPYVLRSEEKIEKMTNKAFALATSSGTAALHLAMRAIGVGPGDEVIVPGLCFVSVANAALYCGATPVFCDVDDNYGINPDCLGDLMTDKTKAVVAAHLYGIPCDIGSIKELCKDRMVCLIEDAAEAIGASLPDELEGDVPMGSFGDISIFSFYGNKTVTCGEGGMAVTNNETFHERMKLLRDHGLPQRMNRYEHSIMGHNYRMTDLQGAVLSAQLDRIESFVEKKRSINGWYRSRLEGLSRIDFPKGHGSPSWWLTTISWIGGDLDFAVDGLYEEGIEAKRFFTPLFDLPYFPNEPGFRVARRLFRQGLCLPSYTNLDEEDVIEICRVVKGIYWRLADGENKV